MDIAKIIGCRFFKAKTREDNTIEVTDLLKVVGLQNESILKVKDLKNNDNIFKIKKAFLESEYTLLEPDAYVMFGIVNLQGNIQDIIVSMFRTKDMENGSNIPYCVCRQNITNLHGAMIRTQDLSSIVPQEVGMCMSLETIPDGIDYSIMTACDSLSHFTMVAAYMDDKLSDLLQCLKINKYDDVLEFLFQEHMKHVVMDKDIVSKDPIHMGYCRTLQSLLEYNSFMYDFRRAFGISEISIDLIENTTEDGKLSPIAKEAIQKAYNKYILEETVIKYDKDIDLDSIAQTRIMVSDANEKVFIITYTEGKEYIENVVRLNSRMKPEEKLEAIFKSEPVSPIPTIPKSFSNFKK